MKTCEQLLKEYNEKNLQRLARKKLVFSGVGDRDVYNITAPFAVSDNDGNKKMVIAGRVEERSSEMSSVYFFVEEGDVWSPMEDVPSLQLQDPFFTYVSGGIVVGGVQLFPHPDDASMLSWRTVFYYGNSIYDMKEIFKGPDGMKDLRIVEMKDGCIGVFTRPQGEKGGRGKIGFTVVPTLSDLSIDAILNAELLEDQFADEEWGGCNEIHVLENNFLGVLGHIACFDNEENRHYYAMSFVFDPLTRKSSPIKLLAVRSDFLPGDAKRKDLEDVVFPGGLVRMGEDAVIYVGIGDAQAQMMTVKNPFFEL